MNIDLTAIINALVGLAAAFVTYRLIPLIKARVAREDRERMAAAIRVAVFAAEQIFGAGGGAEKMDFALKWLREQGYDADRRQVEASVAENLNVPKMLKELLNDEANQKPLEKTIEPDVD